jgi:hypothetical protein
MAIVVNFLVVIHPKNKTITNCHHLLPLSKKKKKAIIVTTIVTFYVVTMRKKKQW